MQVVLEVITRSNGKFTHVDFYVTLESGSINAVCTFSAAANTTAVQAVSSSIDATPFVVNVGGQVLTSTGTTYTASMDTSTGETGSGGLSGGAKAAIVIVVLLCLTVAVYAALVVKGKAPNVLAKFSGGKKAPTKNPYASGGRNVTGMVPNAAYQGTESSSA